MADVFDVLGADHGEYERLFAVLDESLGAVDADERLMTARASVVQWLSGDYARHREAEDKFIWPLVRDHVPNGGHLADEANDQEDEIVALLAQVNGMRADDQGLPCVLAAAISCGRRHVDFAENEVWPQLQSTLSPERSSVLGGLVRRQRYC